MNRKALWKFCCASVVFLGIMTFTPLFTPSGQSQPEVLGMPYTLWMGILLSLVMWVLTYVAVLNHPGKNE